MSLFWKASLSQSTVTCTIAMLPKLEIMNSIFIFPKPERFLGQGEVKRSLSRVWIWRQETQGVSVFTYCLNIPGVSGGCKQRISCYNNRCRPGRGGMPRGCLPGWGKWSVLTVSMMDLLCCGMPVNIAGIGFTVSGRAWRASLLTLQQPHPSLFLSNIFPICHLKFIRSRKEEIAILL